jgi:hypothetical protein
MVYSHDAIAVLLCLFGIGVATLSSKRLAL